MVFVLIGLALLQNGDALKVYPMADIGSAPGSTLYRTKDS